MDEPKEPISQKDAIEILKQAGFFQQYGDLSASEIFNKLHQERINRYSIIFKKYYDPGTATHILVVS